MSLDSRGGLLTADRHAGTASAVDLRVAAFCDPNGPEVFHSIAHRHEIWRADPFDVGSIHEGARATFARLLNRATTPPGLPAGRLLLLKGESGSGKTHLMRVFRNHVHARRLGYCAYLQMTSSARQYDRYLLSNLIDSLDQPYYESQTDASGLMCLSDALVETPSAILQSERQALREDEFTDPDLAAFIGRLADEIREDDRFTPIDVHLIQALLYLQRDEPRVKARVLSYLRCEDLSAYDRSILGGIVPRADADRTIEALGRLMWHLQGVSLVVCVDQLEDMYQADDTGDQFRRVMGTVCDLADRVPSSVWVISCLEDYYEELRERLTRSVIDRIEGADPTPLRLESRRSAEEVRELVACRLRHLYDEAGVEPDPSDPTFPFPEPRLRDLAHLRTRDVLDWCRGYQQECIRAGRLVDHAEPGGSAASSRPAGVADVVEPIDGTTAADGQIVIWLEQAWNDFRAARTQPPPEADAELAGLLAWAVERCGDETDGGQRFSATADDSFVSVEVENPADQSVQLLQVGLCNKSPRGGGLGKQVEALEKRAGEHMPVVVRSTDFPKSPKAEVVLQIGRLVARGGRRVVVEDSDWRTMSAMRAFQERHGTAPGFACWLREERPLSRLKSLREILAIDGLAAQRRNVPEPEPQADTPPAMKSARLDDASADGSIRLGTSRGRRAEPVMLPPRDLTMHAAFLGGSGSGKTTLALGVLEQLLLRGTPIVLIDRKGDLCGYAAEEFRTAPLPDPELASRRNRLRDRLDVRLYTPGNPQGNPLAIPLVPAGLAELPSFERDQAAQYAAAALAGMMNFKQSQSDRARFAILGQAIRLLAEFEPDSTPTLQDLIDFVAERDESLVAAVGRLDVKNFDKLTENLETLRLTRGGLLADDGPRLDVDELFGRRADGRTRLSVVSTKFLGDNAGIEFWVSQFLQAVSRWASRHPSGSLQAALLLDEADMYLPAQRQPATKGPLEDLLKRARSAGVALLLATQSPGDLDYKCRDNIRSWFVGRVKEKTALDKLAPMFGESRGVAFDRIPAQTTGQFHLARDRNVTPFDAERSLLQTRQLAEDEILRLAAETRQGH